MQTATAPAKSPARSDALVAVDQVRKLYPKGTGEDVLVLDNVSLSLRDNEIISLLGRSGCGKTTLLRIIAGLMPASGGEQLQKAIQQTIHFEKLKDHIEMTVTSEGLRIELLEGKNGTFFEKGVAKPTGDGEEILIKLAQELGGLPNKVAIEGHTDAKPYVGAGSYGNWELSADRANSARRLMQENGLGLQQVTQVRGYADQRLRKPADPEDASNRRITLIVQHLVKPEADDEKPEGGPAPKAPGTKAAGRG